jgi:pimeloyl-ACP methyl ester carboxylesterase
MAGHVNLPSLRTWYDERGKGDPLVLLHGGVVDARFFEPNIGPLAARFRVFALDLRGHGHTSDVEGPFSYERLAQDTIEFLEAVVDGPAHIVGHSVGAGVALHVAIRRPDLVRRLVLISGANHHDGVMGADEIDVDQVVQAFGASYGEVSPDGEDHYPVVVRKVIELDQREPALTENDVGKVTSPTLVVASDDDIITLEHTVALYRAIPRSELAIVPGTSHFLTQEKPELCNELIVRFLADDPVATVAPMRRAQLSTS